MRANNQEFELYFISACADEKESRKFRRFGNGLNAAFSSFVFFCQSQGLTWGNKEEREPLTARWEQFRTDNQEAVVQVQGYHLNSVTERKTYSDTKGELTSHKRIAYKKVMSPKETADYLEDRSKYIRSVFNGRLEVKKEVGLELQEASK